MLSVVKEGKLRDASGRGELQMFDLSHQRTRAADGILEPNWREQLIFRYGFSSFKNYNPVRARVTPLPRSRSRLPPPDVNVPPGYELPSVFSLPRYTHKPVPSFAGGSAAGSRESWLHHDVRSTTRRKLASLGIPHVARAGRARSPVNDTLNLTTDEF